MQDISVKNLTSKDRKSAVCVTKALDHLTGLLVVTLAAFVWN